MALKVGSSKAVFLDRDGVLNKDTGYPFRPEDMILVDGAPEAIAHLNRQGYLCVVVTNQSGVARGYFEESDVQNFHKAMGEAFRREGADIAAFYYCPFHPQGSIEAYCVDHPDRKPRPGMIERAIADLGIERQGSFLIGDRQSDMDAASAAGLPGYLFKCGNLHDFIVSLPMAGNT
jgi:D-glycero-D-manno-heptose 1,7-bisphosphate phosphatase